MRLKVLSWFLIFLLIAPFAVMAEENKDMLLERLYAVSGLEIQVERTPTAMQTQFDRFVADHDEFNRFPNGMMDEISRSVKGAFTREEIKRALLEEIRGKMSAEDIHALIDWLDSPVGGKFRQMEDAMYDDEKVGMVRRFIKNLGKSHPSPKRFQVVKQLDAAARLTESNIDKILNMELAVGIAMVASTPKEKRPSVETLSAMIGSMRPDLLKELKFKALLKYCQIYEGASEEELKQYIAFANSSAGRKYRCAIVSGFKKALVHGGYRFGESISAIVRKYSTEPSPFPVHG